MTDGVTARRVCVDDTPESAFIREMKAALAQRGEAVTAGDRLAVEREMVAIMRRYMGPGACEDAQRRDQPMRRHLARVSLVARRYRGGDYDGKLAAAGRDDE
jgi:hypothetical protein